MTKSTITRERLELLSQISCRDDIEDIGGDEIRELASMALAAMDSEPVAVVPEDVRQALSKMDDEIIAELDAEESACRAAMASDPVAEVVSIYGDPEAFGEREIRPLVGIQQMPYGTKLYRHAQPVPVVPDAIPVSRDIDAGYLSGWNDCRAAMLQAVPLTNEGEIQAGNSPVILDGSASMLRRWLAFGRGMQNAGSQLPHNLIAETESMLASAPQEVPDGK